MNLNRVQRSYVAQIRMGVLPLNIETGRYRNIPIENRLCDICKSDVETETHFILYCNSYSDMRRILFNYAIKQNPTFNRLDEVGKLSFLFGECPRQVAKYIVSAFCKRRDLLFK